MSRLPWIRDIVTERKSSFGLGGALVVPVFHHAATRQKINIVRLTAGVARRVVDDGVEIQPALAATECISEQK